MDSNLSKLTGKLKIQTAANSTSSADRARDVGNLPQQHFEDQFNNYVDICLNPPATVLVHKVKGDEGNVNVQRNPDGRGGEPPAKRARMELLDLSGKSQKKGASKASKKQTGLSRYFPSSSIPSSSSTKSRARDMSKLPREEHVPSSENTSRSSKHSVKTKSADPTLHMSPELKAMLMWQKIRAENLDCDYAKVFGQREADALFQECEETLTYYSGELAKVTVYGKQHDIPRKQVAHGDNGVTYTYSSVKIPAKPWTPVLRRIKDKIEQVTQHRYNFVLINRYEDGTQYMGEHRDDEKDLRHGAPVASVSLGCRRDFVFRHRDSRGREAKRNIPPIKLQLEHGSLLLMKYPTNEYWYHALPVRKKAITPRINLTFRDIVT